MWCEYWLFALEGSECEAMSSAFLRFVATGVAARGVAFGLIALAFVSSGAFAVTGPTAYKARAGLHLGFTRIVLEVDSPVAFSHFSAAEPKSIVIEFSDLNFALPENSLDRLSVGLVDTALVASARSGASRMVLHLSQSAAVHDALLYDPRDGYGHRIVVDLVAIDDAEFARNANPAILALSEIKVSEEPASADQRESVVEHTVAPVQVEEPTVVAEAEPVASRAIEVADNDVTAPQEQNPDSLPNVPPVFRKSIVKPDEGTQWVFDGRFLNQTLVPSSVQRDQNDNLINQGSIDQSVGLAFGSDYIRPELFLRFKYKSDTAHFDWNNSVRPIVGAQIRLAPIDGVTIDVGGRYEWERRYRSDRTYEGFKGFVNWSGWWGIAGPQDTGFPLGYVISTWGQLRYPSAFVGIERENLIIEGAGTFDIEWAELEYLGILTTRFDVEYVGDTKSLVWNNAIRPSVGMVLRIPIMEWAQVEIGARYITDYATVTQRSESGFLGFVDLSASWSVVE
jgi:hypothetical protein